MSIDNGETNTTRYSSALCNVILAGTSIWALKMVEAQDFKFAMGTFGIILTNSIVAILRFGHPDFSEALRKVNEYTSFVMMTLPLPFMVAELCFIEKYEYDLYYLPALSGAVLAVSYIISKNKENKLRDLIMAGNIMALLYIAFRTNNHWATALGVSCTINYFALDIIEESFEMPRYDMLTIGFCFFNIFAVKSIVECF